MSEASIRRPAPRRAEGRSPQEQWKEQRTTTRSRAEYGPKMADRGERCQGTNHCSALAASNPNQCFLAPALRASGAVIGVPRQNGRGPVNLFEKHDANHLVW